MDVTKIYNEYSLGKSLNQLERELHKPHGSVKAMFLAHGLATRSNSEANRKYKIQEDFFDCINTQEKAYFLGILFADGYNNTDRNSVTLSLSEKDRALLTALNTLLQPTKPVLFINLWRNRLKCPNTQDQYRLTIGNKHISQKLAELGCVKAKTFDLTLPGDDAVPKGLLRHFVRGYFDGDGSICNYVSGGYPKVTTSMTSTEEFLNGIQVLMQQELCFNPVKLLCRFPERGNNIRSLCYSGRVKCSKFRDWLYKDATIFLERKKQVFDSF